MSESGGRVLANDGGAFFPDRNARRKGWDVDDNGNPLPDSVVNACYEAVRKSFDYPHDGIGNNGGSTGILQQLSQDYVSARFPGKTWGWGSLADTMDVAKACRMFLERLVITSNREYQGYDFDPVAADVLRVQQPKMTEVASGNYSQAKVDAYRAIVDNWRPDYFQD